MRLKILALSLLFPNRPFPNYGIFVLNRLKALKADCDIKIVAPSPKFPLMEKFNRFKNFSLIPAEETIEGFQVTHPFFPIIPRYLKWIDSLSYLLATLPHIREIRKSFDFQIIDVHWVYPDILTAYFCAKLYKKKVIVTVRGLEALHLGEKGIRKKILDFIIKRVDFVITLSHELQSLVEDIGVPREKIKVILNGVNTSEFFLIDQERARAHLGISKGKKVVISVGSLIKTKGHHKIIEALPLLKDLNIDLYIIGGVGLEGDDKTFLEELVKLHRLNNVHFVGKVPHAELINWYNLADLFCFASYSEGCPNVIMEALACGAPIVASDVGAMRDILDTPIKGTIFSSQKKGDLEKKMRAALEKEWDRQAIHSAMKEQSWEKCAKIVLETYEHVLSK